MLLAFFPFLLLFLVGFGVALVTRGLRGRVVDDHPVCRRCRFDLFGLPATSTRCSECGSDLSVPGAIRTGNRRRRPGSILAGALLLLPAIAGFALVAMMATRSIDWIQYAPHWYLLRQAQNPAAAVHDPALAELSRRLALPSLSDSQIASTVDAGLALQADASATWVPAWGDLIESARSAGKVGDEKWKKYLTNAPVLSLSVRPEVRRGDRVLPIRVKELSARCGTRSNIRADISYEVLPDSDLVKPEDQTGSMGSSLTTGGSGWMGTSLPLPADAIAAAVDGPKTLHIKVRMNLSARGSSAVPSGSPDATATIDLRAPWKLVPVDAPTVGGISDPTLRPAVERGIRVQEISYWNSSTYVHIQFQIDKLPVPIAYRILLRAGGREWPTSSIAAPANFSGGWGTGGNARDLTADRVDVILRPDPAVAADTVDVTKYWNGEIVIKDVAVKRNKKN